MADMPQLTDALNAVLHHLRTRPTSGAPAHDRALWHSEQAELMERVAHIPGLTPEIATVMCDGAADFRGEAQRIAAAVS